MPTLAELAQQQADRLDDIPNELFGKIEQSEKEAYKVIIKLVNKLETVDGVIQLTEGNLALIDQIGGTLQTVLFDGSYAVAVREFAKQFDKCNTK